jgi:hypothetical protein
MPRILALIPLLLATGALAQEPPRIQQTQAPGRGTPDCYCRAQGRIFALGETVCLRTVEGARVAECRMAINVTSWGLTDRACPES